MGTEIKGRRQPNRVYARDAIECVQLRAGAIEAKTAAADSLPRLRTRASYANTVLVSMSAIGWKAILKSHAASRVNVTRPDLECDAYRLFRRGPQNRPRGEAAGMPDNVVRPPQIGR